MSRELTDSVAMAASIEALAQEIAAAAKLYQRMVAHRDSLSASLGSLVERLVEVEAIFQAKCAKEAAGGRS